MRAVILFLLLGMHVLAFDAGAQYANRVKFERYAEDNRQVLANADSAVSVVFFGNSITQFWASMRGFFADNGFCGRGIAGQTSYEFLLRFRDDVVNLHPKVVVINAGTNDIAENTFPYVSERTMGNIRSMVEIARANGIDVILTSVLPAASFGWNKSITDAPEKIAALNDMISSYARENGIRYVDYHRALVAADGRSFDSRFCDDGVHPNAAGYEVMEALILPYVKPAQ